MVATELQSWQMIAAATGAARPAWQLERRAAPLPAVKPGEALVEIAGCGVCATDLGYFYEGIPTASSPPLTLGHEISGTVVAGEPAWIGKRVIVPTILPCRACALCRSGRSNACLKQRMPGNSYGPLGGFASHIPVPARELCPVPDDAGLPLEVLAVVADAVATPYQAALRGQIGPGDQVIVVGATGGLGVYMVQWAKLLGAQHVIGIGRNPDKLAALHGFGLDLTLAAADRSAWDIRKEFLSLCRKHRLDARSRWKIFECSGARAGQEIALELLGHAGLLVVVGYSPESLSYHLSRLMAFDAEIRGSWGCPAEHTPHVLAQVLADNIRIRPFVATRPMSQIRDTFDELHHRRAGLERIVLTPDFAPG